MLSRREHFSKNLCGKSRERDGCGVVVWGRWGLGQRRMGSERTKAERDRDGERKDR